MLITAMLALVCFYLFAGVVVLLAGVWTLTKIRQELKKHMQNEEQILDQGLSDLAQASRDGYTSIGTAATTGFGLLTDAINRLVDRVAGLLPVDLTDEVAAVLSIKDAAQTAASTAVQGVNDAVAASVAKIDAIAPVVNTSGGDTPPATGDTPPATSGTDTPPAENPVDSNTGTGGDAAAGGTDTPPVEGGQS